MNMFGFIKRAIISLQCSHVDKFDVCMWNLDFNDCNGERWDGAYAEFCPACQRFGSEMAYGMTNPRTGVPFYIDGRHFVRRLDGREWQLAGDRSKWTPIETFRAAAATPHMKCEPAFQGW